MMVILMLRLTMGKTEMMIIDQNGEDDENLSVFGHGKLPLLQRVLQLFGLQLQLLLGLTQVPGDHQDDEDGDYKDDDDDAVSRSLLFCCDNGDDNVEIMCG